jgi:hypothetical protein
MIISCSVLLRMRNVSAKICRANQNTHFMFNNFFPDNRAVYEIMWGGGYAAEPNRPHMKIRHMRFVCWIPKATNIHPEYAIFISSFSPKQPYLHECASVLRQLLYFQVPSLFSCQHTATNFVPQRSLTVLLFIPEV